MHVILVAKEEDGCGGGGGGGGLYIIYMNIHIQIHLFFCCWD